jgi:hypothetical protein
MMGYGNLDIACTAMSKAKGQYMIKLLATLLLLTLVPAPASSQAPSQERRDEFYWLGQLNKASSVMVVEQGIVPKVLGKTIADAVAQVIADAAKPGARRSGDYLQVEPLIIAVGGPDVTRMHSGRSRQDIGATRNRLFQRDQVLATYSSLNAARAALLDLAARHPDAIVPAYTVGVQAQPISFGHYILGYTQALERNAVRLAQAFAIVNKSPLGSAALGTSSFPVNRPRLAELLGFDGVIENSLDAALLATDSLIEAFRSLSAEAMQGECTVSYSVGYGEHDPEEVRSTLAREVAFCVGHATHHYAILKPLCAQLAVKLPYEFGIAPSTLKHLHMQEAR